MRPIWAFLGASSLLLLSAPQAEAQTTTCSDLQFSAELLNRFPGADEACLDVVEKIHRVKPAFAVFALVDEGFEFTS